MKSFFFAVGMISFIVYREAKIKVNLRETWKGIYNKNEKKPDKTDKLTRSYAIGNRGKIGIVSRFYLTKIVLK